MAASAGGAAVTLHHLVLQAERVEAGAHISTAETKHRSPYNPIDHIFQFHKALKRDLTALEESAQRFNTAVHENGSVAEASPVSCCSAQASYLPMHIAHQSAGPVPMQQG